MVTSPFIKSGSPLLQVASTIYTYTSGRGGDPLNEPFQALPTSFRLKLSFSNNSSPQRLYILKDFTCDMPVPLG